MKSRFGYWNQWRTVATTDSFQSLVSTTATVSESHSHLKENKIPVQGSQRWYSDCTAAGCRPDTSVIFLCFRFAAAGRGGILG